ncbi:cyclic pyranopterin monophosphate synthase subunit MoaA [Desulfobotulus alkaliphilus]|uniref:Cyclic pyranopterin monophosphate synthase subunit MoaA n=1 Tax=Desulfobotulus alkaliphilus TaxID=622671 RepID=A0A562RT81_9BACT|nr:GTP 3',8-cyclase MoaA [Desulfobotulus alkaliphilus]TWI72305.1 cyclic pyranopterin monophosphate synthase subunit MoaA [Desulfobotulus alkaliphilus]
MNAPLQDACARPVNYLRISVTDRCNLACVYCKPLSPSPRLLHEDILRFEEILVIARAALESGIRKIRITGGEPLVRKGTLSFLKKLSHLPGLEKLAITTNGVLLPSSLDQLQDAGVHQINVSLDTLDPEVFFRITGKDAFHGVWAGIEEALARKCFIIKLNAVALRGINEKDFPALASLALDNSLSVRFIEEMPIGHHHHADHRPVLVQEIKNALKDLGPLIPLPSDPLDGPARKFTFPGARGEIGFIPALSRHFCHTCNRLRLTADGRLRPCLLSDISHDIKGPLRRGADKKEIQSIFISCLRHKGAEHIFHPDSEGQVDTAMARIGG